MYSLKYKFLLFFYQYLYFILTFILLFTTYFCHLFSQVFTELLSLSTQQVHFIHWLLQHQHLPFYYQEAPNMAFSTVRHRKINLFLNKILLKAIQKKQDIKVKIIVFYILLHIYVSYISLSLQYIIYFLQNKT